MKKYIDVDLNDKNLIQDGIEFVTLNDFIYIKSSGLDAFLDFCLEQNFCILGIDGVRIYKNKITHDLNYIVDYSIYMDDYDFCLKSIKYSREFLKLIDLNDKNLFFEFTIIQKINLL